MSISYSSRIYKVLKTFMDFFSKVKWPRIQSWINGGIYYRLKLEDHEILKSLLKPNYYFILTRRACHLTTYLISFASFVTTGKFSHYSHSLMNADDGQAITDEQYKLIEATEPDVHISTFMQVFDCDSVALLKPVGVTNAEWVLILDKALKQEGKQYDDLFNVLDDTHLTCVELCRNSLMVIPDYQTRFKNFEDLIKKHGNNLTPQMFYDCGDFEVALEIRR